MFSCGFSLVIFTAIGSLTWPLGNDQGHYSFVADVILNGGTPYRDAWDLKGPLNYLAYAWTRIIFGRSEVSIRIFDLIVVSLFFWQLRQLVLRLNGGQTFGANLAALLFFLVYFGEGYWSTAQPDEWGGMLILSVVSLLLRPARNPYLTMAATGIVLAIATLLKPTFIIFIPLIFLYPARWRNCALNNLKLLFTCILAILLILLASYTVVLRNGGWFDLFEALRFASSAYGNLVQRLERAPQGLPILRDLGLVVPYVLVSVGLWVMWRSGQGRPARMLGSWFSLSIAMLVYQGVYWHYEFLPATIPACVILGISYGYLDKWLEARHLRYAGQAAVFLSIGLTSLAPFISTTFFGAFEWPGYVLGHESRRQYLEQIAEPWDRRRELTELSDFIVGHTAPNDRIQIWGLEISPLTLSRRKAASRFATTWPVFSKTPVRGFYRRVFMQDISQSRPRYIIVDVSGFGGPFRTPPVKEFPEFDQFLHLHYEPPRHVSVFDVYAVHIPGG
jgi:hypothetical protein